jgi:hypothetical protein
MQFQDLRRDLQLEPASSREVVRRDQDLTAEAESLDKAVVEFMSKPPAQRSAAAEEEIRKRIDAVKAERETLNQIFNSRFPDYMALSRPQPVSLQETRACSPMTRRSAWIITSTDADWEELSISKRDLGAQVRALRA